jgi:NOL1/NOP2/sun family putative RNA methylase
MLPATVLDAKPGENVLDLCAAPGGKTSQIAAGMQGEGLLVANDVSSERLKALVKNIELCGVRNAIVTNEQPKNLSVKFKGFFDKILVDAPCSGEGMFRKDENAVKSWGKYKCESCASIQKEILEYADVMLKPGGRLVYSTCTFSPEENEAVIYNFLKKHNNYEVLEIPLTAGIENGRPQWLDNCTVCWCHEEDNQTGSGEHEKIKAALKGTVRLWPHKVKGEGHFVALLEKRRNYADTNNNNTGNSNNNDNNNQWCNHKKQLNNQHKQLINQDKHKVLESKHKISESSLSKEYTVLLESFLRENLKIHAAKAILEGNLILIGSNLYYLPGKLPDLSGIKIVKFGWYLGEFLKGRFEPSHSLIMALNKDDVSKVVNFASDSSEIIKYLKGETIITDILDDIPKGYTAVCVDGFTVGWTKQTGDMLKNLYPKGWRKLRE